MKEIKYGKLINGMLFAFPGYVYDEPKITYNPPEELILAHGYKKVEFYSSPLPLSGGKLIWVESDQSITQELKGDEVYNDPISDYREKHTDKLIQFGHIRNSIKQIDLYIQILIEKARRERPLFSPLYDYLSAKHPDITINGMVALLWEENNNHGSMTPFGNSILSVSPITEIIKENNIKDLSPFFVIAPFIHLKYEVNSYEQIQCNMIFCYLHSVFDDFINSTINLIVLLHPLGAELTIDITPKELFECYDIDDIKKQIIRNKVDSLGYESLQGKMEFLKKRGIVLSPSEDECIDDIILFCECRNVIVHNAGIVNRAFLKKISMTKYKGTYSLGDTITLTQDYVAKLVETVVSFCNDLYDVVKRKYQF